MVGAGGQLSGPFVQLGNAEQTRSILALLELREDIGLPDPRATVPAMADLALRHPQLNLLNLEAAAAGRELGAELWLSPAASARVLPDVLDAEQIRWRTIELRTN